MQSETYEVIDCTLLDKGLDSDYTDLFDSSLLQRQADGTVFTATSTGNAYMNSDTSIGDGVAIEYDILEFTNLTFQVLKKESGQSNYYLTYTVPSTFTAPFVARIEITSTGTVFKIDGETVNTDDNIYSTFRHGINSSTGSLASFKYKNLRLYPI